MPYALTNPRDGEVPTYHYATSASAASPGEVVVPDADFRPGWVWDAANRRLRDPTAADGKRAAGERKKADFSDREQREFLARFPRAGGDPAKALMEYATDIANAPAGQRVSERNAAIKANRDKKERGEANVDAKVKDPAATAADVEAMTWEAQ